MSARLLCRPLLCRPLCSRLLICRALLSGLLLAVVLLAPAPALAQLRFEEGRHYTVVPTPQPSGTVPAGRIEVTEVFSYVCGGCYQAQAMVESLKSTLPADATLTYVHAGFNQGWPLMQRIHLTAQRLGLAERNHERLFAAIWESGEFPYFDPATGQPRRPAPTAADAARFYAKGGGLSEADFIKAFNDAKTEAAVTHTDALIKGWQVPSTPSFVVAGRYRIENSSLSSVDDLRALITHLVGLERARLQRSAPAK